MLINADITVWDSFTTETDHFGTFTIDHKKSLASLARIDGIDPLVLGREIHNLYCDQYGGVEDPRDYVEQGFIFVREGSGAAPDVLVSTWSHKITGAVTTYNCKIWEAR